MKTKKCNGCMCKGKQQDVKLFGKGNDRKNGLQYQCRFCRKEYHRVNSDKIKIRMKKYYKKNKKTLSVSGKKHYKENKEKILQRNEIWRKNNLEKVRATNSNWNKNNPEKLKNYRKKWRKNNLKLVRACGRRRRAQERKIKENFTSIQEDITRKAFNNKCFNCKSTKKLCIDHHRPLSKGHPLTLQNAVVLCFPCNTSKLAKDPEDFYGIKKCKQLDKKLKKLAQLHSK